VIRLTQVALMTALLVCADIPRAHSVLPGPGPALTPSSGELPTLSDIFLSVIGVNSNDKSALRPQSRLQIIRFVSGEFAKVVKPLPAGRKAFRYAARGTFDDKELQQALANHGPAANEGDTVQITSIEFREKEIVVNLNGGSHKHGRLLDHLQIGVGGGGQSAGTGSTTPTAPGIAAAPGVTLILDYGKALPDMSPDDLKHDLSAFLDFSKQHSAAVAWVETLPPEYRQAIKDKKALVGMDHDMVAAALGRPDQKVRERDDKGDELEDWIYGRPPARTVFVTFNGDKVTRVRQYP
jgi:hypothetical protein